MNEWIKKQMEIGQPILMLEFQWINAEAMRENHQCANITVIIVADNCLLMGAKVVVPKFEKQDLHSLQSVLGTNGKIVKSI